MVDTGDSWGPNALKTLKGLKPACAVLRFGDLADRRFEWPDLSAHRPEDLRYAGAPFTLRPHQKEALDDVMAGFEAFDRGKLVMACGTGKTFTALRIAEAVAGPGGRALYLVPSISLFAQSMREWATQKSIPHGYIGICSDTSAGRYREDATLMELEIPVTTSPVRISEELRKERPEQMTVVFCTYQSLPLVERAQQEGAPPFDLILCDEAHRTTGVERADDKKTSPFVLVHDNARIRGRKRLYMTATPRIYTDRSKRKAAKHSIDVFSMDEKEIYGPEFHRLSFSRAIERELLSDYKVVILALAEDRANAVLRKHVSSSEASELNITDAAKIMGCWRALQRRQAAGGNGKADDESERPLTRAIAFANTIKASRLLEKHWDGVVEQAISMLPPEERASALRCSTKHVDGKTRALDRKARIEWLKGKEDGVCRILSNARCLSEGVDVPALDAVFFTAPRRSPVEIVQAVGRVMRKTPDKDYGYIVLPVAIPPGVSPEKALNDNKRFESVWEVLRALRSHDDRFDAEVNRLDLKRPERIIIDIDDSDQWEIAFPPLDLPPEAIFAKIVEKCGDRKYWKTWASDIADIFARLVERIGSLLADPANEALKEWFDGFHQELRESINKSVSESDAVDMVAQHILTRPVFNALFEGYDFARGNPVARALEQLRQDFGEFGLENELRDMEPFYKSVRLRARGLDDSAARQQVLKELYEHFFKIALSKAAERLGIVYTPVEVVDFILRSADHVLREEFGKGLTDEGVHVLDPFTGTGLFPARMLQLDLIDDADVARKYQEEIHANEIVLLAYYIAAVNVEEAFRARRGLGSEYSPFEGIVLTDTFNMNECQTSVFLSENSDRSSRQEQARIEVVVGNPPWSAGQRSSADNNPNARYPAVEARIAKTYAVRSTAANKNSLYDYYKMAIRWASDRIGDQGVVALVTNGSWISGNADSGVRACLAEEFTSIHVVNLRGNQRTQGERSLQEGGKIFGQSSRAPVAITLLVRNPKKYKNGCRILYHDIGDYLKREDKLKILRRVRSIQGISQINSKNGWREITPDPHHDWIDQRDPRFQRFFPISVKVSGADRDARPDAVFRKYSHGYQTGKDAHVYSFSPKACLDNARSMIAEYHCAVREYADNKDSVFHRFASNIKWNAKLRNRVKNGLARKFSDKYLRNVAYRPFVGQILYGDQFFAHRPAHTRAMFPTTEHRGTGIGEQESGHLCFGFGIDEALLDARRQRASRLGAGVKRTVLSPSPIPNNRAICLPGIGSGREFSVFIVDRLPDYHILTNGQCFPRCDWVHSRGYL